MAWQVDAAHSHVAFSVRHMMISTVRGQFKVVRGSLNIDEANPANSWVEAEAETASIDTRDEKRDAHLRSADFFDAEKYPLISFKSTGVEHVGGEEYRVTGDLTMHGATKPVVFTAERTGNVAKDAFGLRRVGFEIKGKINRKEWGLNWNVALEAGGVMVSEDVKIEIDLEVVSPVEAAVQG